MWRCADEILKAHHLPFERHVYAGLGHGFGTSASFNDGVKRTAAFFGGRIDEPEPTVKSVEIGGSMGGLSGWTDVAFFDFGDEYDVFAWQLSEATRSAIVVPKKKRKRLLVKNPGQTRADAAPANSTSARP